MFSKGTMRDKGIDITIKNNPGHVLSPDDWDMVMGVKLKKITPDEYKAWYINLLTSRWKLRKNEFINLAKLGINQDIILKCFCHKNESYCHAFIAAKFMNNLANKLKESSSKF
jgi:hypothetical protein